MPRLDLSQVGQALYGNLWQSDLARELGVSIRTMQRWAAGVKAINPNIWPEVAALCRSRGQALEKIAAEIERSR